MQNFEHNTRDDIEAAYADQGISYNESCDLYWADQYDAPLI